MEFVDFRRLRKSPKIDLIFPGWEEGETVREKTDFKPYFSLLKKCKKMRERR